jgi:hypothetical protein
MPTLCPHCGKHVICLVCASRSADAIALLIMYMIGFAIGLIIGALLW